MPLINGKGTPVPRRAALALLADMNAEQPGALSEMEIDELLMSGIARGIALTIASSEFAMGALQEAGATPEQIVSLIHAVRRWIDGNPVTVMGR